MTTARPISIVLGLCSLLVLAVGCGDNPVEDNTFCPTITSDAVLEAVFNEQYTYDAAATGEPTPTFALTECPADMSINSVTGLISWTPPADCNPNTVVHLTASNVCGTVSQSFTIGVDGLPIGPVVTSSPIIEAAVDQEYTYQVTASGDPSPAFELTKAPPGMTIDAADGLIGWTPTSASSFDSKVTVKASNIGGSTSQSFVVQVIGLEIDGWETSSMVAEGINAVRIRRVAEDIDDGTYERINSLLIIKNGKLVFEDYFNGRIRNSAENIYSAEKSVTSCLMGIAIDRGFIIDENQPLYAFFPEYDPFDNWSEWKDDMLLRHLITMTAGFELEGDDYEIWRTNAGDRDWIKFYLDLPMATEPGRVIDYKSIYDRLAGHVVERQAQTTIPEFAATNLFDPLGMIGWDWSAWNPTENAMLSAELELRAIDMAKLGQVYLEDGLWDGNRIVSEEWIARSTTLNLGNYGYNWWIYNWEVPFGEIDVYYAFGNGGNGIFVFDELQMVVVFTGNNFVNPDYWQNEQNLLKLEILPAAVSGTG